MVFATIYSYIKTQNPVLVNPNYVTYRQLIPLSLNLAHISPDLLAIINIANIRMKVMHFYHICGS